MVWYGIRQIKATQRNTQLFPPFIPRHSFNSTTATATATPHPNAERKNKKKAKESIDEYENSSSSTQLHIERHAIP